MTGVTHTYCMNSMYVCMYVTGSEKILYGRKNKCIQGHIPWICKGGYLHSRISPAKVRREAWSTIAVIAGRCEIHEWNGKTKWGKKQPKVKLKHGKGHRHANL